MADELGAIGPRWSVAPYFIVDDVIASADYYRDKLGFTYDRVPTRFRQTAVTLAGDQEEPEGSH